MNKSDKIGCGMYFVLFLLVVVVLVQTIGVGSSYSFFNVTNELVDKATWFADKVYDVGRDFLGFDNAFSYTDEVYLFRFRFTLNRDNENDPFGNYAEQHYADFLVSVDDNLSRKWTMVYCTVPDMVVTWKSVLGTLTVDLRPKNGEYYVAYVKLPADNWNSKIYQDRYSRDITKMTADNAFNLPLLTYQSYLINIRLHPDVTYYDFASADAFIKDGFLS